MGFVLVFGVVWGVCWWGFVGLVGVLGLVWTRVVEVEMPKRGLFLSFCSVFYGLFYKV